MRDRLFSRDEFLKNLNDELNVQLTIAQPYATDAREIADTAKRLFLVGRGCSAALAEHMVKRYVEIGRSAFFLEDAEPDGELAKSLDSDDVLIVISASYSHRSLHRLVNLFTSKRAQAIVCTLSDSECLRALNQSVTFVSPDAPIIIDEYIAISNSLGLATLFDAVFFSQFPLPAPWRINRSFELARPSLQPREIPRVVNLFFDHDSKVIAKDLERRIRECSKVPVTSCSINDLVHGSAFGLFNHPSEVHSSWNIFFATEAKLTEVGLNFDYVRCDIVVPPECSDVPSLHAFTLAIFARMQECCELSTTVDQTDLMESLWRREKI